MDSSLGRMVDSKQTCFVVVCQSYNCPHTHLWGISALTTLQNCYSLDIWLMSHSCLKTVYCVSGLRTLSYSEQNILWKPGVSVLRWKCWGGNCLMTAVSCNRLSAPPLYLRMGKDIISKIFCLNTRQWTEFRNLVIPNWITFIVLLLGNQNLLPKVKPSWSHGWRKELWNMKRTSRKRNVP
jgi:hypothetical protein